MKKTFFLTILLAIANLSHAQTWDTSQSGQITTDAKVGIGTIFPIAKLHVKNGSHGASTTNSLATFESVDTHVDLISNASGTWGSSLNFIEGNSGTNVNLWSISRTTSTAASSLRFKFGTNSSIEQNSDMMTLTSAGELGIGLISPESKFHIQTTNVGYKSTNGLAAFEGINAHIDLISGDAGSWGSAINFIEGNGNNNTNMWSVARKTTGSNPDLEFTFGTSKDFTQNTPLMTLTSDGNLGLGNTSPDSKLHIRSVNTGIKSEFGTAIIEAQDAQIDLISNSAGDWGSAINFIEGSGSSNTNVWSLARRTSGGGSSLRFNFGNANTHNNPTLMTLRSDGSVGINTVATGIHKLAVNGSIGAEEIVVESPASWSDFVFADDYKLQSLEEVESFINQNRHLPEVPSEAEITKNGVNLGEMDATLLQKIEELTLHMIEMNKRVKQLEEENAKLKAASADK